MRLRMELQDARKLGQGAQEALRKRAVRLVTVERYTQEAAASAVGVARGTVARWVSVYRSLGESGSKSGANAGRIWLHSGR